LIMSLVQEKGVYMVAYYRSYPPGDVFHYGLFVKTKGEDVGTLYHVNQQPSWAFSYKPSNLSQSALAVAATKIGMVEDSTTRGDMIELFSKVPMEQSSRCAPDQEWRCNHWTRDAIDLLVDQGSFLVSCPGIK
jgi:hypothetical protein